jgi:hypothetical protein
LRDACTRGDSGATLCVHCVPVDDDDTVDAALVVVVDTLVGVPRRTSTGDTNTGLAGGSDSTLASRLMPMRGDVGGSEFEAVAVVVAVVVVVVVVLVVDAGADGASSA